MSPWSSAFTLHFRVGESGGGRATDSELHVQIQDGHGVPCRAPTCSGHPGLGYSPRDGRVHFVHQRHRQREGVVVQGLGALRVAAVRAEQRGRG